MNDKSLTHDRTYWLPADVKKNIEREYNERVGQLNDLYVNLINKEKPIKFVLGVSGGIDSALCLQMLRDADISPDDIICWFMDIESSAYDYRCASLVCNSCECELNYISLKKEFEQLSFKFNNYRLSHSSKLPDMNLKARIRMLFQYDQTGSGSDAIYLVVGTENFTEFFLGYCTKWGDQATDISLIYNWTKTEVFWLSEVRNIHPEVLLKVPSAGLAVNQTDEGEIGISYELIDKYIKGCYDDSRLTEDVKKAIITRHLSTRHKFNDQKFETIYRSFMKGSE